MDVNDWDGTVENGRFPLTGRTAIRRALARSLIIWMLKEDSVLMRSV